MTCEKLDLSANWIEGDGGRFMAKVFQENDYIHEIVSSMMVFVPFYNGFGYRVFRTILGAQRNVEAKRFEVDDHFISTFYCRNPQ